MYTYSLYTFGCQMNVGDSLWLKRALTAKGYKEALCENGKECTTDDIGIIYTCSVREKPEEKVYQLIQRLQFLHKDNPKYSIAVGGCVAQQLGKELLDKFPSVKIVFGTDSGTFILSAIDRVLEDPSVRSYLVDFVDEYVERESIITDATTTTLSYVNIMQGCDNFCTYCIVPFTRGKQKSRPLDAVIEECSELIDHGTKEIVLLGQNVNAYGKDNNGESFATLLRAVGKLSGLERLSFMTPHPKDFDDATVDVFASLPILSPRVHLPVQSGSNTILREMGRFYTREEYLCLVEKLRKARADVVFSTDIIVGFPGETEEDFLATLDIVEKVGFVMSFSFCYSDRPNTVASKKENKIPRAVALERLARLQKKQEELRTAYLKECVGTKRVALCENKLSRQPDSLYEYWYAKDLYGNPIHVAFKSGANPTGELVEVLITEANKHTLSAKALDY